jgi:hypothetical protein
MTDTDAPSTDLVTKETGDKGLDAHLIVEHSTFRLDVTLSLALLAASIAAPAGPQDPRMTAS